MKKNIIINFTSKLMINYPFMLINIKNIYMTLIIAVLLQEILVDYIAILNHFMLFCLVILLLGYLMTMNVQKRYAEYSDIYDDSNNCDYRESTSIEDHYYNYESRNYRIGRTIQHLLIYLSLLISILFFILGKIELKEDIVMHDIILSEKISVLDSNSQILNQNYILEINNLKRNIQSLEDKVIISNFKIDSLMKLFTKIK